MFGGHDSGKVECAFFGNYVDELNKKMGKSIGGLPVVAVQYAKVKYLEVMSSLLNLIFLKCLSDIVVPLADKASL
jgi:hypothetical protein